MTSPSERHMEAARAVRDQLCIDCECVFDEGCGCLDAIAAAIANAEREGMRRAAEIAAEFDDEDILLGKDVAEIIRNTILSEIGDKP